MEATVRKGEAAVLALAVAIPAALIGDAPTASATASGHKWNIGTVGYYCYGAQFSTHSAWPGFMNALIGQWNNQPTPHTKPTWYSNGSCSGANGTITVNQVSLDPAQCGRTNNQWNGSYLTTAAVQFSSNKSYWRVSGSGDCNFDTIGLHEFGHSQGLDHSTVSTAVMWPNDNGVTTLQPDDIAVYRSIY